MKNKIKSISLIWGLMAFVSILFQIEASYGGLKLAIAPFQVEHSQDRGIVRCRACGNILPAGPIEGDPTNLLTRLLWERFQETNKGFDLFSPGQVEGVFNIYLSKGIEKDPRLLMKTIGQQMGVEYMLWGGVFEYQERQGTSYGVQQPASIAMDLHLLRVKDGLIIWRAQWAQTQKSLTENLLEMDSFFKRKMRWVTVEELARQGFEKMLHDFPSAESLH